MTPRIAAYLKQGRIPGIGPSTRIDAIKMNTTTFQGGSIVSLLFLDGSETPAYVLRYPRDRARPERVAANYRALRNLQSIAGVTGSVPVPIFQGELNGALLTLESCMHGASLYALASDPARPEQVPAILDRVFDWLYALHSSTWLEPDPAFTRPARSDLQTLIDLDLLSGESAAHIRSVVEPALEEGALKAAFCQGDFNANNVLISGPGTVSVVDWEYSGPGPALFDLFSMARSILIHPEPESVPLAEQLEALVQGETSETLTRALRRYAPAEHTRAALFVYILSLAAGFARASARPADPQLRPWLAYLNSFPSIPRPPRTSAPRRPIGAAV